jgi:hypothetical protein
MYNWRIDMNRIREVIEDNEVDWVMHENFDAIKFYDTRTNRFTDKTETQEEEIL